MKRENIRMVKRWWKKKLIDLSKKSILMYIDLYRETIHKQPQNGTLHSLAFAVVLLIISAVRSVKVKRAYQLSLS